MRMILPEIFLVVLGFMTVLALGSNSSLLFYC
jgi:hypothetical protein